MDELNNQDEKYIKELCEELLKKKGIIITKPFNYEKRQEIYKILKTNSNIRYFPIGDGEKKQIVLRYKILINGKTPVKKLLIEGNTAYRQHHYCTCINKYLEVLSVFNWPKPYLYAMLGLAYMKIWKINLAIDYLTVADYLYKKDNLDNDFTELLLRLKGEVSYEDSKTKTKFKIEEFIEPTNEFDFDELNKYIIESGLDVETACKKRNMTVEQIDKIKLLYAKEYFKKDEIKLGETFLKSYCKSENKTKETISLFNEIVKNKKFYKNRTNDDLKILSLRLKPNN